MIDFRKIPEKVSNKIIIEFNKRLQFKDIAKRYIMIPKNKWNKNKITLSGRH